ncbi:tetratricopeptide repeat protein [Terrihabitans sp. B22-R8]|uniref:tetratricopeptide repeat protein n=1 Tax=Terrihabitans sp. B22-R8 TaxID=3425128 RepID=UPI00403D32A9
MAWLDRILRSKPAGPPPDEAMEIARTAADRGDYESALALWGPLAHGGLPRAQNNIGACFAEGMGVARDADLALRWLTLSAEAGDPVGQRNLAALHFKSEAEGSDAEALRWYRAAAEQGDAPAQDMLSWMLLEAADPALYDEAARWAQAAAEAGIASSMTRLGMIHHEALGTERDADRAALWWRRGAEAGDADAQAMLGAAHMLGQGVPRDGIMALAWLIRAERGGSDLALRFLKPARAALTADEIARAEEAAG